jgi:hypothetical protein
MATYKHLRSSTANKRPTTSITDGQLAINTNTASPGLFFKDSAGTGIVKVGPVHVGTTAPNATPAAGGSSGNYTGEQWLDTSVSPAQMKVWNGSAWVGVVADELPVSKLQDGAARQLLQTDAAGTGVEWTSNVDVPGTLDVTGATTLDSTLTVAGLVGIGTSAPAELMQLRGPGATKLLLSSADNTTDRGVYFGTSDNTALGYIKQEYNTGLFEISSGSGAYTSGIGFRTGGVANRVVIDSSGRVGIGTSPNSLLEISSSSIPQFFISNTSNSISAGGTIGTIDYRAGSSNTVVARMAATADSANEDGAHIIFENRTGGGAFSEKARIDSSGRLLVGTSSTSAACTQLLQGSSGGLALAIQVLSSTASAPANGSALAQITFTDSGHANAVDITARRDGGTWSGTSKPTRLEFSTTADGANSPTERMRITSGGNVLVAKTAVGDPSVVGCELGAAGYGLFTRASESVLIVNRTTDDGTLVSLRQSNIEEGTISVAGTTVSFNGAHLSRWSQIPGIDPYNKVVRPEILRGTVMSNLDEMCDWTCPESGECQDNEQLNKTKISDVEGDKNVAGIFQSWDDDDDTWVNDFYLAMTGDFVIRIAAGTTVERGDLLMSAGDGTAKPQSDDLVRSCTVAKVTSTTVSCTHPDGSYCVPCVLMAC